MKRTATDWIVVHCSASPPKVNMGAREIRRYHKSLGWQDIGYHFVIRRERNENGELLEFGRHIDAVGAHVAGYNHNSVAVCLVGGVDEKLKPVFNFTADQMEELEDVLRALQVKYPGAIIKGHRDFPGVAKACPSFDVATWLNIKNIPNK
jgi:N-acetylmuramoyl-L-alanine amidase